MNKRIIKRLYKAFGLLSALVFLLSSVLVTTTEVAFAEEENIPTILIESRTSENSVHRGQAFTLDIILSNNEKGLTGLFLTLKNYNKDVFSLINVTSNNAFPLKFETTNTAIEGYSVIDPVTGGFNLMWDGETSSDYEGVIATLTFASKITADLGDYAIEFTYDQTNTRTSYKEPIKINLINSTVTLITGEYTVIYKDYDDSILYTKDCLADDVPTYPYDNPYREETAEYYYTFNSWESVVSTNKNEIIYKAQYAETAREYQIFYYVDDDYYAANIYKFGEMLDTPTPTKENHTFMGWYVDASCTVKLSSLYMPAEDLYLYGYFKYNIRDIDIPKITFSNVKIEDNIAYVDAYIVKNTGVNALVLTPSYDRSALTLIGYKKGEILQEMQFSHTKVNTEEDYALEDFNFLWESAVNNYEIGKLITLIFKVTDNLEAGSYFVTFTYDEATDATYVEKNGDIWYTKLQIVAGSVGIGLRYRWNEFVIIEDDIDIDVETEIGKPYNVQLVVDDVTKDTKKTLDSTYTSSIIGDNKKISSVYSTEMTLNDETFDPNTNMLIKIKLTVDQKDYNKLYLYSLDSENKMSEVNCEIKDGYVEFNATAHAKWAIVCDKATIDGAIGPNTFILILLPSLLAVATMGTFLIFLGKKRKNDENHYEEE